MLSGSRPFRERHIGPDREQRRRMLRALGVDSLDELIDAAVPASIRSSRPLALPDARSEHEVLDRLRQLAARNRVHRSFLGMGYHGTRTPAALRRAILENPAWYTAYTPYQAEISQGRLEALLNFQTMVRELTGMEVANASLLDEATAAAEAMTLCHRVHREPSRDRFLVDRNAHPQTLAVLATRAEPLGFRLEVVDLHGADVGSDVFGALVHYPGSDGAVFDLAPLVEKVHAAGALMVCATDLLALTWLKPPGEFGADVVVGNSQRFGVPLWFGGPHAAYLAARAAYQRKMPGRLVGVSRDAQGRPALRLALQTREQHIRRERATSNICTAQVLLAVTAAMYAVYHGPDGLRAIAAEVHDRARALAETLADAGHEPVHAAFFDTLRVRPADGDGGAVVRRARERGINLRPFEDGTVGVALDETATDEDLRGIAEAFGVDRAPRRGDAEPDFGLLTRTSDFLRHPVFLEHHSELEFVRYARRLESRDLSLVHSMISLGSCTMKLNAAVELLPITEPGFADVHPFAPLEQSPGYLELIDELSAWLCEITGFAACSFQPNAGSQGEYAGLLVIRAYHRDRGEPERDVCLIPTSAHGTNPASAVLAGMRVVAVRCDEGGNIDMDDLSARAREHADRLAAVMVTYPSTHGVFEEGIRTLCDIVHESGGLVYLDGANMNALVGLVRPAELGADVCHLNLHKTFAIPHGGGGPGVGPICVTARLAPFLPGHPVHPCGGEKAIPAVAAAPFGSPGILPISYAYIALLGPEGLADATRVAILNANYVAKRLDPVFPVLYRGAGGRVAHECILDLRPALERSGLVVDDVAKRLMDYGFHAPTMSFPVPNTFMVEPTESESLSELDRFCAAMESIAGEMDRVAAGEIPPDRSVLRGAPHTAREIAADEWSRPYSRLEAAFPAPWTLEAKFWPHVGRIDNVWGDRHPCCSWSPASTDERES